MIVSDNEIPYDSNLSKNETIIYIQQLDDALLNQYCMFDDAQMIHWSKYQIKETDMRIKTATFTSPQYIDLTTGQYCVLITSPYHEDFGGVLLKVEYDKDTGLYQYQCQDFSRKLQSKYDFNSQTMTLYDILTFLITDCNTTFPKATQKDLEGWKVELSGLHPVDWYDSLNFGAKLSENPMKQTLRIHVRDTPKIRIIRDLVFSLIQNSDVYYDKYGILHIEKFNAVDFRNTGVYIKTNEISDIKFKFDLTNVVSHVYVMNDGGNALEGQSFINDLLDQFVGVVRTDKSYSAKNTSSSTTNATKTTTTTTSNPYGNKAKKIWINADNGSASMKSQVISKLKSNGWSVHDGGTGPGTHYPQYFSVTKDYQVYATMYNGFCAGTIREAYSSTIQNELKKKGVVLVVMFDTQGWTNPQGMKPYRNGDFSGYNASRAWDDNFSSSDPSIKNVGQWLKSKDAKYCAGPTADQIVKQFLAGGYFKWAGK